MKKTRVSTKPYVDANVLVYALLDKGELGQKARERFWKGATISSLTIDEALGVAKRNGYTDFSTMTHEILMHPALEFIEVHPITSLRASEIMMKHGLKSRDAMHAAVMEEEGIQEILSYDKDFNRIPGIKRIEP